MMAAILDHNMSGWKHILDEKLTVEDNQQVPEILAQNPLRPPVVVLPLEGQQIMDELEAIINELEKRERRELYLHPYRRNPYSRE